MGGSRSYPWFYAFFRTPLYHSQRIFYEISTCPISHVWKILQAYWSPQAQKKHFKENRNSCVKDWWYFIPWGSQGKSWIYWSLTCCNVIVLETASRNGCSPDPFKKNHSQNPTCSKFYKFESWRKSRSGIANALTFVTCLEKNLNAKSDRCLINWKDNVPSLWGV